MAAEAAAQNAAKLKKVVGVDTVLKNLRTLLLYFGISFASMKVGVIRDHCKKLKQDNIPKKEYRKWT